MTYNWNMQQVTTVTDIRERYKVDLEKIRNENVQVLKAIYDAGTQHLQYFYQSMKHFKFPELRIKTYDTRYYEEVMPIVIGILKDKGELTI